MLRYPWSFPTCGQRRGHHDGVEGAARRADGAGGPESISQVYLGRQEKYAHPVRQDTEGTIWPAKERSPILPEARWRSREQRIRP